MGPIKFKTWITWAVILFVLGVLADYYFLHILFKEKQDMLNGAVPAATSSVPTSQDKNAQAVTSATPTAEVTPQGTETESNKDNFLESLQKCSPDIAAQAIATPEALIEYLRKTVGVKSEDVSIENYHLTLKDGSQRRVHIRTADNTNTQNKKEIRLFKVDNEGYPEPIPLKGDETLESLLAQGQVNNHELKSTLTLKDGGHANLEMHDNQVYEFQYDDKGKILSCRLKDCQCP